MRTLLALLNTSYLLNFTDWLIIIHINKNHKSIQKKTGTRKVRTKVCGSKQLIYIKKTRYSNIKYREIWNRRKSIRRKFYLSQINIFLSKKYNSSHLVLLHRIGSRAGRVCARRPRRRSRARRDATPTAARSPYPGTAPRSILMYNEIAFINNIFKQ